MADRYLLESGAPDGYLLEDGTGVLLLDANAPNLDDDGEGWWSSAQSAIVRGVTSVALALTVGNAIAATNQYQDEITTAPAAAQPASAESPYGQRKAERTVFIQWPQADELPTPAAPSFTDNSDDYFKVPPRARDPVEANVTVWAVNESSIPPVAVDDASDAPAANPPPPAPVVRVWNEQDELPTQAAASTPLDAADADAPAWRPPPRPAFLLPYGQADEYTPPAVVDDEATPPAASVIVTAIARAWPALGSEDELPVTAATTPLDADEAAAPTPRQPLPQPAFLSPHGQADEFAPPAVVDDNAPAWPPLAAAQPLPPAAATQWPDEYVAPAAILADNDAAPPPTPAAAAPARAWAAIGSEDELPTPPAATLADEPEPWQNTVVLCPPQAPSFLGSEDELPVTPVADFADEPELWQAPWVVAVPPQAYTAPDDAVTVPQCDCGLSPQHAAWLELLARAHGLIDPLTVSATERSDGTLVQTVAEAAGTVTLTTTAAPSGVNGPSALTAKQAAWLEALVRLHAGIDPLAVTATERGDGTLHQTLSVVGAVTTVTRTS